MQSDSEAQQGPNEATETAVTQQWTHGTLVRPRATEPAEVSFLHDALGKSMQTHREDWSSGCLLTISVPRVPSESPCTPRRRAMCLSGWRGAMVHG